MSLSADLLARLADIAQDELAPSLEDHYAAGPVAVTAIVVRMASEMLDGAVQRLADDTDGMAELLRAGGAEVPPAAASLRLSDMTAARDAHAEALIALQERLEADMASSRAAATLNARVWQHLALSAAARLPQPPRPNKDAASEDG